MKRYRLKKKYAILSLVLGALGLFSIIVGGSYAFFTHQVTSKDYVIYTGNLQIDYTKTGNLINLTNAYPKTNTEGLMQEGYSFNITNNGSVDARYQIRLELDNNNTLPLEYIKMAYIRTRSNSNEVDEEIEPVLLSNLNNTLTFITNKQIEKGKTDSYTLKLWIDYNAPNDTQGKTFKASIVVDSLQDVEDSYVMADTRPIIALNKFSDGNTDVHLLQGATFTDPGILSVKDDKDLLTGEDVTVSYEYTSDGENLSTVNSVNTNTPGVYYVNYSITDSSNNTSTAVRVVTVNSTPSIPVISLNGNSTITTYQYSTFTDPGVTVASNNKIARIGEVKTSAPGTYTVRYIVIDSEGSINSVVRTVVVDAWPGVNPPELYDGLVAIKYSNDGQIYKADTTQEWYNYDDHKWANAAILTSSGAAKTTEALDPTTDIYQMYVWIPRYKYQLFNTGDGTSANEQMINITFEEANATKSTGTTNGEWLTHPAFTFGNTELPGFWVGKFEPSASSTPSCTDEACAGADNIKIIPNVSSVREMTVSNQFYTARSIARTGNIFGLNSTQIDSHMMKNMEWGAVAYLTNSKYGLYATSDTCVNSVHNYTNGTRKGCQVWINPVVPITTGCSGTAIKQSNQSTCQVWNDSTYGGRSSTTGNLYGIYDMAGGEEEYVMGNMADENGDFYPSSAGTFSTTPNAKYYDLYEYYGSGGYEIHNRGKLGDATKETLVTYGYIYGEWYENYANIPNSSHSWFQRGGQSYNGMDAGIFSFSNNNGSASSEYSFRPVLSAQ